MRPCARQPEVRLATKEERVRRAAGGGRTVAIPNLVAALDDPRDIPIGCGLAGLRVLRSKLLEHAQQLFG